MGTIKPLPESVRNSMRSGIVLFDLTRVVEELVFNSLDAGATKVSVYVAVGTCYVKVVDDGCGISRDGLVLLGERYVTSKLHHLAAMDAANESFGLRGEALASISDVALLEIITKTRGRPNGYRKVLKGSKCLYLGVNDDRKDVGTSVVVRDLFYNQPVRRKCLQSSPKKVLDSVKKCVLRIAFVHANVSFKVIDTESEDELLCTRPSSPLSLLMSCFQIKDSNFLHVLDVNDGILKLSGYISGPCDTLTIKAFQYVYINSRFVCRGPIHKLIDHLATKFECMDPCKANSMPRKGKRYKPQACPMYILNLSCPSTFYNLTFESSKTHVDFKDSMLVLNFIETSIQQLWMGTMTCDLIKNHEIAMTKRETQKQKSSHYISSPQLKIVTKKVGSSYYEEIDKIPLQEFSMNGSGFKEPEIDSEFLCHRNYTLQSLDSSPSKHFATVTQKSDSHLFSSDNNSFSDGYFMGDRATVTQKHSDHVEGHVLGLDWQSNSPLLRSLEIDNSSESSFLMDYHKFGDEIDVKKKYEKSILQSCSSRRNMPLEGSLFSSEEGLEFSDDGFKNKRRHICADGNVDFLMVDSRNYRFELPGALWHEATCSQKFSAPTAGVDMAANFDNLSEASESSFSFCRRLCAEKKYMESSSEWCHLCADSLFRDTSWCVDHFLDDNKHEGSDAMDNPAECMHFVGDKGRDCSYSYNDGALDFMDNADTRAASDFGDSAGPRKDISKLFQGCNIPNELPLEHSNISLPETDCLPLDFISRGLKNHDGYKCKESHSRFQDWKYNGFPKECSRRSQSAPPFYEQKRRFVSLSHYSMIKEGNACNGLISPETDDLKDLNDFQPNCADDLMLYSRSSLKNRQVIMMDMKEIKEDENVKHSHSTWIGDSPVAGLNPKEIRESTDYGTKWGNGCQDIANNNTSSNINNQHNILDISSGFLHLAGNSLIPKSIHRNFLEHSKVLQQVDKKFIPVMASGTLAIIDQHAADERIRLEELRQKVLSGEARTVACLDTEKELILPEIGYQLLQNFSAQIRDWGWICNFQAHSGSFKKNLNILHQQPTVVTLLAVPCILGVNLSDGDLLEFLQQLADTDGSSTMPQSVLRILNFKACRGAIMFGDPLLPSECALIVEELKKTSLCFQCAHGRPTTVPLVNLEELHKQIAKLGVVDGELWHGLRRQELSIERAAQRLSSARS